MSSLNNQVQAFTDRVQTEAGTVFGNANSVFNDIMGSVQNIVNGGPSQMGFSSEELAARNATATAGGAAETRNIKGAADTSTGNVATPAGVQQQLDLGAEHAGAATTAEGISQNKIQDALAGHQNYETALSAEKAAPEVFGVANGFNQTVAAQQERAAVSEQNIDTQKNWWKDPVMKVGAAAAQFIPYVGPYVSAAIKATQQNYDQEQQEAASSAQAAGQNASQSAAQEQDSPMTPPPTSSEGSPYDGGDLSAGSGWGSNNGNNGSTDA